MIIIGHKLSPIKNIYTIKNSIDIKHTPPNGLVCFDYDEDLILYCQSNGVKFAIFVSSTQDVLLGNLSGAMILIVKDLDIAKEYQRLATEYLFDSKIIVQINKISEIDKVAQYSIDGVIFKNCISKKFDL